MIDVLTVENLDSFGEGSFHQALQDANNSIADSVIIELKISEISSDTIIKFSSNGVKITKDRLFINGYTDSLAAATSGYTKPKLYLEPMTNADSICFDVNADLVTICGIGMIGFKKGIVLNESTNFKIIDNTIIYKNDFANISGTCGVAYCGESISMKVNGIIHLNVFTGYEHGVLLKEGRSFNITQNYFSYNNYGILFSDCEAVCFEFNKLGFDFYPSNLIRGNKITSMRLEGACNDFDILYNDFVGLADSIIVTSNENIGIEIDQKSDGDNSKIPNTIFIYNNCFGVTNCGIGGIEKGYFPVGQGLNVAIDIKAGSNIRLGVIRDSSSLDNINYFGGGNNIAFCETVLKTSSNVDSLIFLNNHLQCNQNVWERNDIITVAAPAITNVLYLTNNDTFSVEGTGQPGTLIELFAYNPFICADSPPQSTKQIQFTDILVDESGNWKIKIDPFYIEDPNYSFPVHYPLPKYFLATATDKQSKTTSEFSDLFELSFCDTDENCIWPGDANNDGRVNHVDLLPIGLSYGNVGQQRQDMTTDWSPKSCVFWNPQSSFYDDCFADCNGDGQIDGLDRTIIYQNYDSVYYSTFSPFTYGERSEIQLDFVLEKEIIEGEVNDFDLNLNAPNSIDVMGFAFSVEFKLADTTILASLGMEAPVVNFESSILGTIETDMIGFDVILDKNTQANEWVQWDISLIRTDNKSVNVGSGTVCSLDCIMDVGSVDKTDSEIPIEIKIKDLLIIGGEGESIAGKDQLFNHSILKNATAIQSLEAENYCNYLNIFKHQISIDFNEIQSTSNIKIFDLHGSLISSNEVNAGEHIELSNLGLGLYVVSLNDGECIKKFVKY